jgi:FAD/FMN-containing dehydrogenase
VALRALREAVSGRVILPADDGYAAAARVWNAAHQGRPEVVVACADQADVAAALRFARTTGLPVAVRGGGFTPNGVASGSGGVVVDTRALRSVTVDRSAGTVTVGAGATWGDIDPATQ